MGLKYRRFCVSTSWGLMAGKRIDTGRRSRGASGKSWVDSKGKYIVEYWGQGAKPPIFHLRPPQDFPESIPSPPPSIKPFSSHHTSLCWSPLSKAMWPIQHYQALKIPEPQQDSAKKHLYWGLIKPMHKLINKLYRESNELD